MKQLNIKIISFGILLILLSLSFTISKKVKMKLKQNEETKQIELFLSQGQTPYIAVLEIPKIKLKKGLYDIENKMNTVEKGIYISPVSTFPNNKESHLILASHSGNSSISYFKNLNKLQQNDEVILYYLNKKYIYKVTKQEEIKKTGTYSYKEEKENTLILITCIKNSNRQLVIHTTLKEIKNSE